MAEKIKIAELNIDDKALLKSLEDTKKAIKELANENKHLAKSGADTSKAFIENDAKLKTLRGEYSSQIKVLQAVTNSNEDLTNALKKEVKSIDDAAKNNKELKQIRNQLNASTEEGAKAIKDINDKLDKNTDFIKDNTSALEQQKQNIGNYPGLLGKMSDGIGGAVKSLVSMTRASLAFIATPIGAVIAVLAGAFALVKNAMDRSEESTNKIKRAFSAFTGIISTVMKALEPLGSLLIDGIVKGLDLLEKGINKSITALADALDYLGFDEKAAQVRNFGKAIEEGAAASKALADAEAQLQKSQRESQKIQLEYQRQAEKLRQIRDDESKSMAERQKANEDLGEVLKRQAMDELAIANQAVAVAQMKAKINGENAESLDALAEAETRVAEIQERITSQESEQLVNRNSLLKESQALREEDAAKRAEEAAKKDEERLAELEKDKDFLARKQELLDEAALRKAETEQERAILEEEQRLEQELLDLENTEFSIEQKNLLKELLEQEHQDRIAFIKGEYAAKELEDEDKKNTELLGKLSAANDAIIAEEQRKASEVAGIASQLAGILQGFLGDSLAAQLAAIAVDTVIKAISVKSAAAASSARNLAQATAALPPPFNIPLIATAVGQNVVTMGAATAAIGKIVGQGAISGLGAVAKSLQNKSGKKRTFAQGGILYGPSHSNGGIKTPFGELEGGEAVINRNSTATFRPLLSAINEAGGGRKFAKGGVMGNASTPNVELIDYNRLAEAMSSIPSPVVAVEEINRVGSRVVDVQEGSTF